MNTSSAEDYIFGYTSHAVGLTAAEVQMLPEVKDEFRKAVAEFEGEKARPAKGPDLSKMWAEAERLVEGRLS